VQNDRKMSASCEIPLDVIARLFGVTVRQVRRWCADGLIPDAYRDAKGRWHVPRRTSEEVEAFIMNLIDAMLREAKRRIFAGYDEIREAMIALSGYPDEAFADLVEPDPQQLRSGWFFPDGTPSPIIDPNAEYRRWRCWIPSHLVRRLLVCDPLTTLRIKAQILRSRGVNPVRANDLAGIMGISKRTLYNPPYGAELVREVCRGPDIKDSPSGRPKRGHTLLDWMTLYGDPTEDEGN
jgi:hypothetical protein